MIKNHDVEYHFTNHDPFLILINSCNIKHMCLSLKTKTTSKINRHVCFNHKTTYSIHIHGIRWKNLRQSSHTRQIQSCF